MIRRLELRAPRYERLHKESLAAEEEAKATVDKYENAMKKEFVQVRTKLKQLRKDALIQLLEHGMTRELFAWSLVVPTYYRGLSIFSTSTIKANLFAVWGGVSDNKFVGTRN